MRKRLLRAVLALSAALMLTVPALAAEVSATPPPIPTEGDVWDGTTQEPTKLVYVDDIAYYEISTCEELAFLAHNEDWQRYNYILANNLILNDVVLTWDEEGNCTNTEDLLEWSPINLTGTFDGAGYSISGLYIDQPEASKIGLFSTANEVIDLNLVNAYVCGRISVGGFIGDDGDAENCTFSGLCKASEASCGGISGSCDSVISCINYGQIMGDRGVGGISGGYSSVSSCTNFGAVIGDTAVGGIIGYAGQSESCTNFGTITGDTAVGGITGRNSGVYRCVNYGDIFGRVYVGGLGGSCYVSFDSWGMPIYEFPGSLSNSSNYGSVTGFEYVGGITGKLGHNDLSHRGSSISNFGSVTGQTNVGGIAGESVGGIISNAYNIGTVVGNDFAAGITGKGNEFENCYNIGTVSGTGTVGSLLSWDDPIWTPVEITASYYLSGQGLSGCGGLTADPDGVTAATSEQLQQQSTFANWDFEDTWAISPDKNGGYPYLQWQEDTISDVPLTGVSLSATSKTIAVGDVIYLTPSHSPATAPAPEYSWSTSDKSVVKVSQNGRIEAVGAGSAVVTLSGGGHTATCTVTVDYRTPTDYRLNALTVRDLDGKSLSSIPEDDFWASISLTKLAKNGNVTVLLAAYDEDGRFVRMLCAAAEDLIQNQSVTFSLYLNNSSGEIASLKAFAVSSLGNLTPLCAAIEF